MPARAVSLHSNLTRLRAALPRCCEPTGDCLARAQRAAAEMPLSHGTGENLGWPG